MQNLEIICLHSLQSIVNEKSDFIHLNHVDNFTKIMFYIITATLLSPLLIIT